MDVKKINDEEQEQLSMEIPSSSSGICSIKIIPIRNAKNNPKNKVNIKNSLF